LTFAVTGLTPGTSYQFKVEAVNVPGYQSSTGPSVSASTPVDTTPPSWPSGSQLRATHVQPTSLTLTWTAAQDPRGIASYRIFKGSSSLGSVDAATLSFAVTGLQPGTSYQFKVEAVDVPGYQSSTGPSISVTTAVLDPNTSYVTQLYLTILGRAPDSWGLSAWVRFLQSGGSRFLVAQGFWQSVEHRGLQVDGFYATFLHRAAEAAGRMSWINALEGGMSETDVEEAFLTSPEYQTAHPDALGFTSALYRDGLGRAGEAAGVALWSSRAQSADARPAIARSFLTSAEAIWQTVDRFYGDFLHRAAESTGRDSWFSALQSGRASMGLVAEEFLSSDEFFARAGNAGI
jgi:hypothetical protein